MKYRVVYFQVEYIIGVLWSMEPNQAKSKNNESNFCNPDKYEIKMTTLISS